MNDLDLIREFRSEVPALSAADLAAGRHRLVAAISEPARRSDRPRAPLPRLIGLGLRRPSAVLAISLAAAAVVLALSMTGGRTTTSSRSHAGMRLASEVLHHAAIVRSGHIVRQPAPGQWIYDRGVDLEFGQPAQRTGYWARFDGREEAYLQSGKLVTHTLSHTATPASDPLHAYLANPTPMTSFRALASLPSNPRTLLRRVLVVTQHGYDSNGLPTLARIPVNTPGRLEFQFLAQLLWQDTQTGLVSGGPNVFRALSLIPGVVAEIGLRDALGRRAIGLSDDGGEFQILLSPGEYSVLGYRTVSVGHAPEKPNGGHYPTGVVLQSVAVAPRLVSGPGVR
jgi:hypothetical protein